MLTKAKTWIFVSALAAFLGFVGTAGATADSNLTSVTGDVQDYFTSNIGTVIALFVSIALLLWMLAIALRSVGVRKPNKVD